MPERIIKIILPKEESTKALELLESLDKLPYWQEERSTKYFIASILADASESESVMDLFEKKFGRTKGFNLILLPVEASLPRKKETKKKTETPAKNGKSKARISREELYKDIVESTRLDNTYILMTILSTVVVAIGLMKDNVAIIIGAMVIAPFLGPNVGLALSSVLAEKKLGSDAIRTLLAGGFIVIAFASAMGLIFDVNSNAGEIASRTSTGYSDIILALASGAAGVLAFTTGASAAVIGVMVAVALLPPLTVFGLLLGSGEYDLALGALMLFMTNIICVNLAGVVTFIFKGVSPRTWYATGKSKKETRKALFIWISTLILLIALIFVLSHFE